MAVIVPGKLLFLAHPRTGSMALRDALVVHAGGRHLADHHADHDDPRVHKVYMGEPMVCVVRNPYDVLVTWWLKRGKSSTFLEFLQTYQDHNFTRRGKLFYHVDAPNVRVLRYETDDVFAELGVHQWSSNVTKDKAPWQSYYTELEYKAANERFLDEFERHGYPVIEG